MGVFDALYWKYLVAIKKFSMSEIQQTIPEIAGRNFTEAERVFLKKCTLSKHKELKYIFKKFQNPTFELVKMLDTQSKTHIPNGAGIYLVDNIFIDINTNDIAYWIKVGYSTDIKTRMSEYRTHNPKFEPIDFYTIKNMGRVFAKEELKVYEKICHFALNQIAQGRINSEWFLVSKEDYTKIRKEGFKWFGLE